MAAAAVDAKRPNGAGSKRSASKTKKARAAKVARVKDDGSDSKVPARRRRGRPTKREQAEEQQRQLRVKREAEHEVLAAKAEWDDQDPYTGGSIKNRWWAKAQLLIMTVPTHVPEALCKLILSYATPMHYFGDLWEASFSVPRPFESYERMYAPLLELREKYDKARDALEFKRQMLDIWLQCPNGPLLYFQESNRMRNEFEANRKTHYGIPQFAGKTHFYVTVRRCAVICDKDPFEPVLRPGDSCLRIELDAPIVSMIMYPHKNGMLQRYNTGSMERNVAYFLGEEHQRIRTSVPVADPIADPPRATDYLLVVVRS